MPSFNSLFRNYGFYLLWIALNTLQAIFTDLADDEAYYWVFSERLDWGYFDHPPMIAAMIKLGYLLFASELGVRLWSVLATTVTIYLLERLIRPQQKGFFYLLILSVFSLHVYGFIAVPDTPLLFFTALFFWAFKRYLNQDNVINVILLAAAVSGLLYSKYHGLLVIVFTLLANWSLLQKRSFYGVVIAAILFYLPHIIWQIQNDYPPYQFHVLNKSQAPYSMMDTVNYLLGQLVIFGPFTGWMLFFILFKSRVKNSFERALKFTAFGFLLFFLGASFNSRIEPNWTVAICIPLLVLAYPRFSDFPRLRKWLPVLSLSSLALILFARTLLIFNPFTTMNTEEFHGWKERARFIEQQADGKPVVFVNSYQRASKYAFYSGQPAISLNDWHYRKNQFDLWNDLEEWKHQSVAVIRDWGSDDEGHPVFEVESIPDFVSYNQISLSTEQKKFDFPPDSAVQIMLTVTNPYAYPISFKQEGIQPYIGYRIDHFGKNHTYQERVVDLGDKVLEKTIDLPVTIHTPSEKGIYFISFGISSELFRAGKNSRWIQMNVGE